MPETKLSEFQREMLAAFPPGTRTRQRLYRWWRRIDGTGRKLAERWAVERAKVSNPDEVSRMDRELLAFQTRMGRYGNILSDETQGAGVIGAKVVRGLILSPGPGTHIADSLFPISFGARMELLKDHESERLRLLLGDMAAEARKMLADAEDAAKQLGARLDPVVVAVVGTVLGGLVLHYAFTGRKR